MEMELELEQFFQPPAWSEGHIRINDARFIDNLLQNLSPRGAIEIGVASGCSSAVILRGLNRGRRSGILYSFDIAARCYFAKDYSTGFAAKELASRYIQNWRLYVNHTSIDAARVLTGLEVPFVFIDGNHSHPWPTLDLLALLPALAPSACVVLHDIHAFQGPKFLYNHYPYSKIDSHNIGALYLPDNHDRVRDVCLQLLAKPWPEPVQRSFLSELNTYGYAIHDVSMQDFIQKIQMIVCNTQKPLWIWGAGAAGHILRDELQTAGLPVACFVDSNKKLQHSNTGDTPVLDPAYLLHQNPKPIVLVASLSHNAIKNELKRINYLENIDFYVLNDSGAPLINKAQGQYKGYPLTKDEWPIGWSAE